MVTWGNPHFKTNPSGCLSLVNLGRAQACSALSAVDMTTHGIDILRKSAWSLGMQGFSGIIGELYGIIWDLMGFNGIWTISHDMDFKIWFDERFMGFNRDITNNHRDWKIKSVKGHQWWSVLELMGWVHGMAIFQSWALGDDNLLDVALDICLFVVFCSNSWSNTRNT